MGGFRSVPPPCPPCSSSYSWQLVCDLQTPPLSFELLNAAFQRLWASSLSEGIKCSSLILSVLKALSGSEHYLPCNWFHRSPVFFFPLEISSGGSEGTRLSFTHECLWLLFSDGVKTAFPVPSRLSYKSVSLNCFFSGPCLWLDLCYLYNHNELCRWGQANNLSGYLTTFYGKIVKKTLKLVGFFRVQVVALVWFGLVFPCLGFMSYSKF